MNVATTTFLELVVKMKNRAIVIIIKYLNCVINKELQINYN